MYAEVKVLDLLKLELQMVVSRNVGTGNWTQVLWKSTTDRNQWAISPAPKGFKKKEKKGWYIYLSNIYRKRQHLSQIG